MVRQMEKKMKKQLVIIGCLSLMLFGCAKDYTLRMVHKSVYDGADIVAQDARDADYGMYQSYNNLSKFSSDLVQQRYRELGLSEEDRDATLADLQKERETFDAHRKPLVRIPAMSKEIKNGLGWYEGPSSSLNDMAAGAAVGAAVGAAAVAAF